MNKMVGSLICLMMVMTLSSCATKEPQSHSSSFGDTLTTSGDSSSTTSSTSLNDAKKPDASQPSSLVLYDPEVIALDKKNIHSMTDTISSDEISFSNFKSEKTNTLPTEIDKARFNFWGNADKNGVLNDGYTYMFATYSVTNITNQKLGYYFNSSLFCELDESLDVNFGYGDIDASGEARYISGGDSNGGDDKDSFRREINANETITETIGYILENDLANSKDLYFLAALPWSAIENSKAIKIEGI